MDRDGWSDLGRIYAVFPLHNRFDLHFTLTLDCPEWSMSFLAARAILTFAWQPFLRLLIIYKGLEGSSIRVVEGSSGVSKCRLQQFTFFTWLDVSAEELDSVIFLVVLTQSFFFGIDWLHTLRRRLLSIAFADMFCKFRADR